MNASTKKNFILVKESLINNIFGPYAKDDFRLVGYQKQTKAADKISFLPLIQVYFIGSQIDWNSTRAKGNFIHVATYQIDITVALPSKIDLSIMLDPLATAEQKMSVLDQTVESGALADETIDDLYSLIISILRDPRNSNLGLDPKVLKIANVRPEQFQKDDPLEQGALVVNTANLILTCRVPESVSGEEGIVSDKTLKGTLDINNDPEQKTALESNTGG